MARLELAHIKLLLKLVAFPSDAGAINAKGMAPNSKTSLTLCRRLARELARHELIEAPPQIIKIHTTEAGTQAAFDPAIPLEPTVRRLLKDARRGGITPRHQATRALGADPEPPLRQLERQGLVTLDEAIHWIRLTEAGRRFLREDYRPTQTSGQFTPQMLGNYAAFLRAELGTTPPAIPPKTLDAEALYQTVERLQQDAPGGLVPLYAVREAVEPPLDRASTDAHLYALAREDRIELITVQEQSNFTPQQLAAGIPQRVGGPLFYVTIPSD